MCTVCYIHRCVLVVVCRFVVELRSEEGASRGCCIITLTLRLLKIPMVTDNTKDNTKRSGRKRKYRHDGTPIWSKRTIDGPGVWVSCVKGKEKQTVGELYDLFDSIAADIWPDESDESDSEEAKKFTPAASEDMPPSKPTGELSIEEQLAKEIATMKGPRKDHQRFSNCVTNTPCVVFIGCKAPVDPVKLVQTHVHQVESTGISQTRYVSYLNWEKAAKPSNLLIGILSGWSLHPIPASRTFLRLLRSVDGSSYPFSTGKERASRRIA
jgi:hypothetical protein